jgi:hypothetical protein
LFGFPDEWAHRPRRWSNHLQDPFFAKLKKKKPRFLAKNSKIQQKNNKNKKN